MTNWLERIPYAEYAQNAYHVSRYDFVSRFIKNKSVLDIACASGYGSHFLRNAGARFVVGMDIDETAIRHGIRSASEFATSVAFFVAASTSRIPLADRSLETVVSLETIEHLTDVDAALSEFVRILTADGLLIRSTPNALITKPVNGVPRNPFHVREYRPDELIGVLSKHFGRIELWGQRILAKKKAEMIDERTTEPITHHALSVLIARWQSFIRGPMLRQLSSYFMRRKGKNHNWLTLDDLKISQSDAERSNVLIAVCRVE